MKDELALVAGSGTAQRLPAGPFRRRAGLSQTAAIVRADVKSRTLAERVAWDFIVRHRPEHTGGIDD